MNLRFFLLATALFSRSSVLLSHMIVNHVSTEFYASTRQFESRIPLSVINEYMCPVQTNVGDADNNEAGEEVCSICLLSFSNEDDSDVEDYTQKAQSHKEDAKTTTTAMIIDTEGATSDMSTEKGQIVARKKEEEKNFKLQLGCGHVFHPDCAGHWLHWHGTCPNCRQQVKPREQE